MLNKNVCDVCGGKMRITYLDVIDADNFGSKIPNVPVLMCRNFRCYHVEFTAESKKYILSYHQHVA